MNLRAAIFGVVALILVAATAAYVATRAGQSRQAEIAAAPPTPSGPTTLQDLLARPHVVFLDAPDFSHRHLAVASLEHPGERVVTQTVCDRVYASPAGGFCLGVDGTVAYRYNARPLDAALQPGTLFEIQGVPSRTRVSSNAKFAAATVFVAGDSYGAPFSTRTYLFDLDAQQVLGNLEDFSVSNNDTPFQSPTFNFWGITFAADERHFYATLGVGDFAGTTRLVEGDLQSRSLRVLRDNVECPSLSPDGTRIAFKKRISDRPGEWHLAILDLATMQDTLLNEERSVDDQVEWLDNTHVLYGVAEVGTSGTLETNVWLTPTDASATPSIYLPGALSPSVVRSS